MEVRIEHVLGVEEAVRRLLATATAHDIRIEQNSDGVSGRLEKSAGFLGSVRAEYVLSADHVSITVLEAPAVIPAETVRRMIADELTGMFA